MNAKLVSQFPTNGGPGIAVTESQVAETQGRNPYREAPPRPPSAEQANPRIAELDIDENWPASISRDEPQKLSVETRAHTFFVRTKKRGLMANIDVLGFIAKCPDAGDGQGVVVHRDVIQSLAYHLIDKVHELETLRNGPIEEHLLPAQRYDEKYSTALDRLGGKDAEIKELRATLGEAAVKIRRLESKLFK
jgi:hypothetical protein